MLRRAGTSLAALRLQAATEPFAGLECMDHLWIGRRQLQTTASSALKMAGAPIPLTTGR